MRSGNLAFSVGKADAGDETEDVVDAGDEADDAVVEEEGDKEGILPSPL